MSPNNVLVTKNGEILFIDLEFISMGDPFIDLANFSHDANYSSEKTIELLEIYLGRKANNHEIKKLLFLCAAVSVMWYLWAVYKMNVEEHNRLMYQEYRDLYLEYANRMYKTSLKY